ncbi:hypothetical protein EHV15_35770 [Paenibacillus oralis]|uniref:Uncharacterized protein n=1 Tax=Paenibacillus oralis TaxID=2490856 RepID=A0A3P3TAM4_9BACL|nr:hypothetical protein [Paenibacillus oralis]RRJ54932.1 hypothetical protein EHV15_35770 [Paenibacillus oralis]
MNKNEAIRMVLDKRVTAIGARMMSLVDVPNGEVYEDCFLDLYNQDHNAKILEGNLVLELWFADYKITGVTPQAILDTRIEKPIFRKNHDV